MVDELSPSQAIGRREALIEFVTDRPGHDFRYAIDPQDTERELAWRPKHTFDDALRASVKWYIDHQSWCARVASRTDRERLGLGGTRS
jgi:dTDP-glucose 4,6-dehydratase